MDKFQERHDVCRYFSHSKTCKLNKKPTCSTIDLFGRHTCYVTHLTHNRLICMQVNIGKIIYLNCKEDMKTWLIIIVIHNVSSCEIKAWTGFEPMTSTIPERSWVQRQRIFNLTIHQIFSLVQGWSQCIMWPNIPQPKLGNIREYSPIFKTASVAKKTLSVPRSSQFSLRYILKKLFASWNR